MRTSRAGRERLVVLALLAAYAAALAALLASHEMWRDELQAWMLARDSGSLVDLWRNTRYEGHPLLWHLLLYVPAHVFGSPVAMQALHWVIATAGAAVVLLRAPFSLVVRAGIVFSYLPLYEYGAISRNYAATALALWLACAALAACRTPWPAVAAGIVAANSSPMGLVLVPALGCAIGLTPAWKRRRWPALAVLAAGAAVAALQCLPPPDYEHARGWFTGWDLERAAYVLRGYAVALLPLPAGGIHFWGSSLLFPAWPFPAGTVGSVAASAGAIVAVAVAGIAVSVHTSARALATWLAGSAALLAFAYVKLPGAVRHQGFLWVLMLVTLWLAAADGAIGKRRTALWLAPLLVAGVGAAVAAAWWDAREPFSGARCAAAELRARGLDRLPLVGGVDFATSGVAGYLPRGRLYYPASESDGSYVVWNLARKRQDRLAPPELVTAALGRDRGEGAVLLLNAPLGADAAGGCREVLHCGPAIVADEELWGYVCGGPAVRR